MIQPSIGRIVLYRPDGIDPAADPHAGIVIAVHDARSINLACFSPVGTYYHREEVHLLQDDDTAPAEGGYAEWMPFQKGQASKTEAATGPLHDRLTAIEQALVAGGPIHLLFEDVKSGLGGQVAGLQKDIDAKLEELGNWTVRKFGEVEHKLGGPAPVAPTPPAPTDPAANAAPPQPDPAAASQTDPGPGAAPVPQA